MKKNLLIIIFFFSCYIKAQHLTQGIPFDTTLFTGAYMPNGGCSQTVQARVSLDPALFSYPDGMHFYMIFDSVYCGCAPACPCPDLKGDTIELTAANPEFQSITNYYSFWFRIKLVGTPATVGQPYPCHIQTNLCTCFCTDITIAPASGTSTCTVDISNSLSEMNSTKRIIIYPNPANDSFQMEDLAKNDRVMIYNSLGECVKKWYVNNDTTMDVSKLPTGVYSLLIEKENESKQTAKLIISR